jgi:hypothetical protein
MSIPTSVAPARHEFTFKDQAHVIFSRKDLSGLTTAALIALYNTFNSDKPLKAIRDKEAFADRVWPFVVAAVEAAGTKGSKTPEDDTFLQTGLRKKPGVRAKRFNLPNIDPDRKPPASRQVEGVETCKRRLVFDMLVAAGAEGITFHDMMTVGWAAKSKDDPVTTCYEGVRLISTSNGYGLKTLDNGRTIILGA